MIFILSCIILLFLFFNFFLKKNDIWNAMFLFTFAFTMCGTLNEDVYKFIFLMPHEWIILITFIFLLQLGMVKKRRYPLAITWIDKLFMFYLATAVAIPFLANAGSDARKVTQEESANANGEATAMRRKVRRSMRELIGGLPSWWARGAPRVAAPVPRW